MLIEIGVKAIKPNHNYANGGKNHQRPLTQYI